MKISRSLILFFGIFLAWIGSIFAGCDWWFSFSTNCEVKPVYCQNGECSITSWVDATTQAIWGQISTKPISQYAQDIITYLISFISLVAVIYIIYAGFTLMIGAGDEEKMKKTKNIILYVILGVILIWLSFGIVKWVIALVKPGSVTSIEHIKTSIWRIFLPETRAAYSENSSDTFKEYQSHIKVALENLEAELRVNWSVSVANLQNIKSLVQAWYDRLPDNSDFTTINSTAKRAVDMYIDIAIGNPKSTQKVGDAISKTSAFITGVKIGQISGNISATPGEWNAPLSVSFLATDVIDPSWTTPWTSNYIWWIRENGWVRRELWRWPSLMYTFTQEWTFTINLDVISWSRNSKGKTDVLPLSISKSISVKPKLGEIILLVNGVNVSNIDSIKINPTLGKMGIILDATASRAIGNGNIIKTFWKFGNGNEMTYDGKPIVERQVYGNQGTYPLELQIETNDGKKVTKKLQIIARDPSAVIQMEDAPVHVGQAIHVSALSYFTSTNNTNVEYSWQIQDDNNQKVLKSAAGKTLDYTFWAIGKYIITLNARSANGNIDSDSRTIVVESREPIVNLETPTPLSKERPNTIVFNASKSYDPDTKSDNGLIYSWSIDDKKVDLSNQTENGAKWTLTFPSIWNHTVSLTVSNSYGKVATVTKTFTIESILSVDMLATPQVAPIETPLTFVARSESADFYEWNFWDGTPTISGGSKVVQHSFQKTGNYTITLTVSSKQWGKTNQTQKKVYITDANNPYSIITVSNGSNTAYEDIEACGSSGAIVITRSEPTSLNASKSVNVDGSTNNLTYTWNYFGKTKTVATISEKFWELWCFPIKLTVRSNKNGSTHTSTQMVFLKNQPPELTSISTNVDTTKKDSQKLLVKVSANGAIDPDGVITSYIWYYTTESDKEPQNIQITQKPEITFVLPNITEKYFFWVILEDNDGARTNSTNNSNEQVPLIVSNQNGNIYLPLITLSTAKTTITTGENIQFAVTAKTIVGSDITAKSEYAWDFDGDWKIDQKTTSANVDYRYEKSWNYTMKVRVTYNGVSNTKYQTIYVKNELKASAQWFRLPNGSYYFLNSSEWSYDKALWKYTWGNLESLYSVTMEPNTPIHNDIIGTLTVSNGNADISTANILASTIETINNSGTDVVYQTSPKAVNDTIHLKSSVDKILLSMLGNKPTITRFAVDTNTLIDSDLDGKWDNDSDNKDLPSFQDGTVFSITDLNINRGREQNIKITLYQGNTPVSSKTLRVIFDFIPESSSGSWENLMGISSGSMNAFDRAKLDELASLIRSIDDTNRLILMKSYNSLVENWDDTFTKSRTLIEIQSLVDESPIPADKKAAISTTINDLLSGESQSTDDITLAAKLIAGLISKSQNAAILTEKLSAIESHPQSFEENVILAKEIFEIIQKDSSIDDDTKKYIYNQLGVIKNGWGQNMDQESVQAPDKSGFRSGILGFIGGVVKVFFIIVGLVVFVILLGYIFYRISRKSDNIGFQDFLIDSVFHVGKWSQKTESAISTTQQTDSKKPNEPIRQEVRPAIAMKSETESIATEVSSDPHPVVDPMTVLELNKSTHSAPPPVPSIPVSSAESLIISEPVSVKWELKNITIESPVSWTDTIAVTNSWEPQKEETPEETPTEDTNIPDWLKMPEEVTGEKVVPQEKEAPAPDTSESFIPASDVPDWLKLPEEPAEEKEASNDAPATQEPEKASFLEEKQSPPEAIPDWLVASVQPEESAVPTIVETKPDAATDIELPTIVETTSDTATDTEVAPVKKKRTKKSEEPKSSTSSPSSADNIPDWLK